MKTFAGMVLLIGIVATSAAAAFAQDAQPRATAEIKDASGAVVGTMTLIQEGDAVHVLGRLHNLPAGVHGIHIHAVGRCTPDFKAAGPHFNPMGKQHGLQNHAGPHAGDLTNLTINADGTGRYNAKDAMVSLRPGPMSLFDADGSSIVIHAKPDDYNTDPAGNSGDRIACGVITMVQPPAAGPGALPNTGRASPILPLVVLVAAGLTVGSILVRRAHHA